MPLSSRNGDLVTGVGMTHYAHTRIGRQDALQTGSCRGGAIRHNYLTCVLAVANPDAAAVVE